MSRKPILRRCEIGGAVDSVILRIGCEISEVRDKGQKEYGPGQRSTTVASAISVGKRLHQVTLANIVAESNWTGQSRECHNVRQFWKFDVSIQAPRVPIVPYWRAARGAPPAQSVIGRTTLISRFAGLLGLISAPVWGSALFFGHDYHIPIDYLVVAVVMAAALCFVVFVSRTDPVLREVMLSGLLLKLAAGSIYIYVVYRVYHAEADLPTYHWNGYLMAFDLTTTGRWPILEPLVGTNFVKFSVAMLYSIFGPSLPGATAIYLSIAFLGQYLLYRAFYIAYPAGDRYTAALFMFLLPSILYWPSSLGKDCQSLLAIGMVTYGLAFASRRVGLRGYVHIALGLVVIFMVRPHMAGILAITCAFPYIFGKNRTGLWGGILKLMVAPALLGITLFLAQQGAEFVDSSSSSTQSTLDTIGARNASGGSTFNVNTSVPMRIAMSPFLMFRPFPWEAHNIQSLIASAEGLFLLIFVWKQRRWFVAALRRVGTDPFAAYALSYALVFSVLFAGAMTNFGLLARQRVMMLPVALMLFLAADTRVMSLTAQSSVKTFAGWIRGMSRRKSSTRWSMR